MMRSYVCDKCGKTFQGDNIEKCPYCDSVYLTIRLTFSDDISLHDKLSAKVKKDGIKNPIKEIVQGDDYSYSKKKYMSKTRIIDRENDHYHEKVSDKETGEIVHECDEPLKDHLGHGSTKKKKQ